MRLDLYWAKVDKSGDCWLWLGASTKHGYGLWTDCRHPRKTWQTHRLSWVLHHGPIPDGLCVLHHCDTPGCVNPDHLWLGTALDNARDKVAKGRMRRGDFKGEANGHAILTEVDVREIRRLRASGVKGVDLAQQFGVSQMTVSDLHHRRRWKHVL